ncbi:MAG: hypothetical protein GWP27_07470 [Bacteroidetes bacterium]|nr:hypothetical protein [Bacteroidota bacterium]
MRCVVIGSKELGCVIVDELVRQKHSIPLVITRDDSPGMALWHKMGHRSLKEVATRHGLNVLEGVKVNDDTTLNAIREARPDLILSCFWSDLFKSEILMIPSRGVFNFHTAFLPKNRGSRPIPWAMINGDEFTGITLHQMQLGVDDGPIVATKKVAITDSDTGKTMYDKVMREGVNLVTEVIALFGEGKEVLTPQEDADSTFHLRGEPYGGQFNYFWDETEVDRFKRSFIFPPFQAHRNPPQSKQLKQGVSLIVSSERSSESWNELSAQNQFTQDLRPYQIESGGDSAMRKVLRTWNPKGGAQLCYFPTQKSGLDAHYPILESLMRGDYLASISSLETLDGSPERCQPFRYENGILELPVNYVNPSKEELQSHLHTAQRFSAKYDCTCYLHILLDEHYGTDDHELFTRELSQQIQNSTISLMTYGDVCEEFNTEYEDISA